MASLGLSVVWLVKCFCFVGYLDFHTLENVCFFIFCCYYANLLCGWSVGEALVSSYKVQRLSLVNEIDSLLVSFPSSLG